MTDASQVPITPHKLTRKESVFVDAYVETWNASEAARRAKYKWAPDLGKRLLKKQYIQDAINERIRGVQMSPDEVLSRLAQQARVNAAQFFDFEEVEVKDENGHKIIDPITLKTVTRFEMTRIDWEHFKEFGYLVKKLDFTRQGKPKIEFHDPQRALEMIGRANQLFLEQAQPEQSGEQMPFMLPADVIAPPFIPAYRDIRNRLHTEYLFFGGRGSTKSSFVSLVTIYLIVNNPTMHGLAVRQVANTLRDSVYAQLQWAINELGLRDKFKCTTSPLEIEYLPTGQKIYFRGGDDPLKIKSIKPQFGYIGILWFEELDQFHGAEQVRSIEQSAIRGGDTAYIFKSFNPPRTQANWANKYAKVPKATQYQHHSNYLDVPPEWLGKAFLEEAEHLKSVNPGAYDHEYMGLATGVGGLVFENVQLRKITDEEIAQFDHVLHGLDWGFYPDPAHYGRQHYDAARRILYIFGEYRAWKRSNENLYKDITRLGATPDVTIIADSAEPKSVADFKAFAGEPVQVLDAFGQPVFMDDGRPLEIFGPSCRGAEKGPDSVSYSIKWLQGLTAIVIDNERCPYAAEEFIDYEYEQDPDGNFISEYPDKNNHAIDETRYATNLIWRRRGQ